MPTPNLQVLDKQLCFAEFSNIIPIININKTELDEEKSEEIFNIYTKTRISSNKNKCRNRETE